MTTSPATPMSCPYCGNDGILIYRVVESPFENHDLFRVAHGGTAMRPEHPGCGWQGFVAQDREWATSDLDRQLGTQKSTEQGTEQ